MCLRNSDGHESDSDGHGSGAGSVHGEPRYPVTQGNTEANGLCKTSGGHGRQHIQAPLAKEAKTGSAGYGKTVFNALKYLPYAEIHEFIATLG